MPKDLKPIETILRNRISAALETGIVLHSVGTQVIVAGDVIHPKFGERAPYVCPVYAAALGLEVDPDKYGAYVYTKDVREILAKDLKLKPSEIEVLENGFMGYFKYKGPHMAFLEIGLNMRHDFMQAGVLVD